MSRNPMRGLIVLAAIALFVHMWLAKQPDTCPDGKCPAPAPTPKLPDPAPPKKPAPQP